MKDIVEYNLGECNTCGGELFGIKINGEVYVCCDECGSIYLNPGDAYIGQNMSRLDLLKDVKMEEVSFNEILNKGWDIYLSIRVFGKNEWISYKEWSERK